jgi:hypothetical protein
VPLHPHEGRLGELDQLRDVGQQRERPIPDTHLVEAEQHIAGHLHLRLAVALLDSEVDAQLLGALSVGHLLVDVAQLRTGHLRHRQRRQSLHLIVLTAARLGVAPPMAARQPR